VATRIIVVGAGPIGLGVAREVAARPSLALAGLVDTDPTKEASVAGVPVTRTLPQLDPSSGPTVAVLTTSSSLHKIERTALELIDRSMHVVSTCEELAWPWSGARAAIAHRIDDAAKKRGVCVLGTGVNPGFLMDALPLAFTALSRRVERVRVERVQDAALRRRAFQDKVGVGMHRKDVEERLRARLMGHVGLEESARMIAERLGFAIDSFAEDMTVVVADADIDRSSTAGRHVRAGEVSGVEQIGRAFNDGSVMVELFFRATFGQVDARDRVVIEGDPPMDININGGVPGDVATCAIVANAIPVLLVARPGLRTMAEVPLVAWSR
jgi:4-hydroxy-tetrahydrodipicolinate reductase